MKDKLRIFPPKTEASLVLVNDYPCLLRTFIRLDTRSCYCTKLDQWISIRLCKVCEKREPLTLESKEFFESHRGGDRE